MGISRVSDGGVQEEWYAEREAGNYVEMFGQCRK